MLAVPLVGAITSLGTDLRVGFLHWFWCLQATQPIPFRRDWPIPLRTDDCIALIAGRRKTGRVRTQTEMI